MSEAWASARPRPTHRPTPSSRALIPAGDDFNSACETSLTPANRKLRVLLLSSDTGGGHRASAAALSAAIEEALPGKVKVNIVDFWVDFAKGPFAKFPQQYAFLAKHPFLWKTTYELTRFPPFRFLTESVFDTFCHQRVRQAFNDYAPDVIVSVHPLINTLSLHVLRNMALATGRPRVPYVTVVTDLGGAHPTWFHPEADMTYVPTSAVETIASKCRVPAAKVRLIGLPVRSDFWGPPPEKMQLRAQKGLLEDCPAILLIGGGDGVGKLGKIARVLSKRLHADVGPRGAQLVIVCGKNATLAESLRKQNYKIPVHVLGYVSDMSDWMAAVDIICTKAGPGTIAESLIRGLPILLHSYLPGQEAANVRYVVDHGVGEYATRPGRIAKTLSRWLTEPGLMERMSVRAREFGAPRATQQIVHHILRVAAHKRCRNAKVVENQLRLRNAQDALIAQTEMARLHLFAGSQTSSRSHLLFHLKSFLRFAVGAVIARDSVGYVPSYWRLWQDDDADTIDGQSRRRPRRSIELPRERSLR